MRPLFLQRLSGRVARQVCGTNREPVHQPDLRGAYFLMSVLGALFAACFASFLMIAFFGDRILNLFCGA